MPNAEAPNPEQGRQKAQAQMRFVDSLDIPAQLSSSFDDDNSCHLVRGDCRSIDVATIHEPEQFQPQRREMCPMALSCQLDDKHQFNVSAPAYLRFSSDIEYDFDYTATARCQRTSSSDSNYADEKRNLAAITIQKWWRRQSQRQKTERMALRDLIRTQKNRLLAGSLRGGGTGSKTTNTIKSKFTPPGLQRIQKTHMASESHQSGGDSPSPLTNVPKVDDLTNAKDNHGISMKGNESYYQQLSAGDETLPTKTSKKPNEKIPPTIADAKSSIISAIISDLEALEAVHSELVLANGEKPAVHEEWAQTVHKINQMLTEAQSTTFRNKQLEKRLSVITCQRSSRPMTTIDDLDASLKELSSVRGLKNNPCEPRGYDSSRERVPTAGRTISLSDCYHADPFLEPPPVLTPRQICPINTVMPAKSWVVSEEYESVGEVNQDEKKQTIYFIKGADFQSDCRSPVCESFIGKTERQLSDQRVCNQLKKQWEIMEKKMKNNEQRLRDEYDAKLESNYQMIDDLIAEKKTLTEQCDQLVKDMREMTDKAVAKQKLLEDNHKVELRKAADKAAAAEKLKRERWEAAKTKSLKDLAVKGVEREIQRLAAKHKEELDSLMQQCRADIDAADGRAFERYTQKVEELRSNLTREKEEACAKERKEATERMESLVLEERATLETLRKRLQQEAATESERMKVSFERERVLLEGRLANLDVALVKANETHEKDMARLKNDLETRHRVETANLQARFDAEKANLVESSHSRLEAELLKREREIAERLRRERDRQLESAIRRLEEENSQTREETENAAQEKIRRAKEKHQQDIEELEAAARQVTEKYNQMRTRCLELEGENNLVRVRIAQRDEELKEVLATKEKLLGERDRIQEVIRQEFVDQLAESEAQMNQLRREIAEVKLQAQKDVSKVEAELSTVRTAAALELESVHQRIREAIIKKDANIKELTWQHQKQLENLKVQLAITKNRCCQLEASDDNDDLNDAERPAKHATPPSSHPRQPSASLANGSTSRVKSNNAARVKAVTVRRQ